MSFKLKSLYGLSGGAKEGSFSARLGLPTPSLPERSIARLQNSAAKQAWRDRQKANGEWVK